jgi:DHA3 family macrolide efflux protein-like MFS transporter
MQGRVITVLDSGATAMMPISLALAAPIAEFFGVRMWFFIAGGLCALIALAAFFIKPIVTVEDNGQHSIQAVPEPTMLAE